MMDIKKYVLDHDIDSVLQIEHSDRQFIALKNAWVKIVDLKKQKEFDLELAKEIFLWLVIQNSLVSYQIAGTGELRWTEFAKKVESDFFVLQDMYVCGKCNVDRWYDFLIGSKYNKRIYNIKTRRLRKFSKFVKEKKLSMMGYYQDMEKLLEDICKVMGNHKNSKTMVFAVKMFGYGARIVFEKLIYYPMSIAIPVDSRIKKIAKGVGLVDDVEIQKYFQNLAESKGIPPLHLDSLLWVKKLL